MTLKELRLEKGFSQAKLSKWCSVSEAHISNVENGKVDASLTLCRKIAGAFGVTHWEVLKAIEKSQEERKKRERETKPVSEEKTVCVEFSAEYIEKLIKDSHKLEMILDGLYSGACRSTTRDDSIFFPVGNVNAVLKATDGERYFDELDRLENE